MERVEEIPRILPYGSPDPFKLFVEKSSDSDPVDAVSFVGLYVLRGTMVPYTIALLIIGIDLGSLGYTLLRKFGGSWHLILSINLINILLKLT